MHKKKENALVHVRVPPELGNWLKEMAKINHRSINSEIVFSLENEKARRASNTTGLNESSTNAN